MPVFMDVHDSLGEASSEDVRAAHERDLAMQDDFGVRWLTYWFNDAGGKAFCLVESPDAETAVACHKAAHGLSPHEIIEVSGDTLAGFFGEWQMDDGDRVVLPGSDGAPDTALRAIMFTDITGSTAISSTQGDEAAMRALELHDGVVRECLAIGSGREVKHTGDGILASFVSVSGAVDAAIEMQRRLEERRSTTEGSTIEVSIGISAGEPVHRSNDLFGASVNLAARLCSHASPSQILVASAVRDLSIGKGFVFVDSGTIALKGFEEPVQVYEVPWLG